MSLFRRFRSQLAQTVGSARARVANRLVEFSRLDPRIVYPSYKSLDEWIDVDRLRSLDGYVAERLERRGSAADVAFYTGQLLSDAAKPTRPGSRMIYLTDTKRRPYPTDPALWFATAAAEEFSELMAFVRTLPFDWITRVVLFYDFNGAPVTAHRDHAHTEVCDEFVWFRTNLNKPFYLFDRRTEQRRYVRSYAAWFDTCNQFHGADAKAGLSFSVRVDGKFSATLRAEIPQPSVNPASTASLWATLSGECGPEV